MEQATQQAELAISRARGRKDKDKDDGAAIKLKPLKYSLREFGELAIKRAEANTKFKEAIKAVSEKSNLNASTVRRLVKALGGDSDDFADEKRRVEQLGIVFDEIEYEGEITKALKE